MNGKNRHNMRKIKEQFICPDPDMDYNEILRLLYECNFVKNWLYKKIDPEFVEDVQQDVFESLANKEAVIRPLWKKQGLNGVRKYVSGLLVRMVNPMGSYTRWYKNRIITETPITRVDARELFQDPLEELMLQSGMYENPIEPEI